MPVPAFAIAGGLLSTGGIAGSLLSRPNSTNPNDFTPDLSQLQAYADQLNDPNFGLRELVLGAIDTVGPESDFLQVTQALGGSRLQANQRFEQARSGGVESAVRTQGLQQGNNRDRAAQILAIIAQLEANGLIASNVANQRRSEATSGIFGQLAGAGAGILGFGLGGGFSNRTNDGGGFGGQQNVGSSFGQNRFSPTNFINQGPFGG